MAFLRRNQQGWLAVGLRSGRIDIVHVVRQAEKRPRVTRLESYARDGNDVTALSLLRKQKGLKGYRCTSLLDPGMYQLVQVDAPDVPRAEWKDAVRWRLKDVLDYPVDSATLDVCDIPVDSSAVGRSRSIFAVAANNTNLTPVVRLFQDSKLDLHAIDIPEMAQRNIAALFEEENRGLALLTFDSAGGLLTFTYRAELYLARRIEISAEQIERADEERRKQLYERIGLELQRSLDNFERMYNFISVSKVMLGPSSFVSSLVEFLRDYVYVPVSVLDLTSVLDCDATPELREPALQAERLSIIGAALREDLGAA